jgi:hypothetical protein
VKEQFLPQFCRVKTRVKVISDFLHFYGLGKTTMDVVLFISD